MVKIKEIWKPVPGFIDYYQVSNMGRVRSLDRKVNHNKGGSAVKRGRILKPNFDKDGYYAYCLCYKNKKKTQRAHRLVAEAFIDNPSNLPCVNHKDENKTNNAVDNLEWCDIKYNTNYNNAPSRRGLSRRKPIIQKSLNGKHIKLWSGRAEAQAALGVSGGNITSCCRGNRKTAYGYIWEYA